GPPGVAGHHGDRGHAGLGGTAARGVDDVVHGLAVAGPRPLEAGAGDDGAVGHGNLEQLAVGLERVFDRHPPAFGPGGRAHAAHVAAQAHAGAGRAPRENFGGDQVGGVALADAAQVERHAGRKGDGPDAGGQVDGCAPRSTAGGRSTGGTGGGRVAAVTGLHLLEGAVVPQGVQGREHGRVEPTGREIPRVHRPGDDVEGLLRHQGRPAGRGVQPAQLAGGPEPAPAAFQFLDAGFGPIEEGRAEVRPGVVGADDDQVGLGPHGREGALVDGGHDPALTWGAGCRRTWAERWWSWSWAEPWSWSSAWEPSWSAGSAGWQAAAWPSCRPRPGEVPWCWAPRWSVWHRNPSGRACPPRGPR